MNEVAIRLDQDDQLPALCAKTGLPTDYVMKQEFAEVPGWTVLLMFWGIIPFLIATGFARRKVTVELPISPDTLRSIRRVDMFTLVAFVVAVGLLVTALLIGELGLAVGAVLAAFATLMAGSLGRSLVWVRGRLDGAVVRLYGVNPTFAAAVVARSGINPA